MEQLSFIIRVWESNDDGESVILASLQQASHDKVHYFNSVTACLDECRQMIDAHVDRDWGSKPAADT